MERIDIEKQRQQANLHKKLMERKKRRQEAQKRKQEREMAKELLEQQKELTDVRSEHVRHLVFLCRSMTKMLRNKLETKQLAKSTRVTRRTRHANARVVLYLFFLAV